ncbi:hypothetical protein KAF25_005208 [Fusarium avenaceum]|uniref:Uncharacterized protein n=1 Tax=Fusarium avenaceum TaxID=40199 RepID=A0A9P7KVL3_9HYPO|nr:hypothetical protein KAF25_005208 [Fusarium avenaceum]
MAPFTEPHHIRWQNEAKRAFGATLPAWTVADDNDDYDVHIMKTPSRRSRTRRDNSRVASKEPEVMISILREPFNKRTEDKATKATTVETEKPTTYDDKLESESDSESGEDGKSGSDSDSEDDKEDGGESEKEEDGTEQDTADADSTDPINIKLPASSTNNPSVAAPSAEGSAADSGGLVAGSDGIHSNVHKILLGVGSVGGFLLLLGLGFLIWKFYSKRGSPEKTVPVDDMSFDKPSRFETLVSKVPFLGSRFGHQGWYTIEAPTPPPSYSAEKMQPLSPSPTILSPLPMPPLPKQSSSHLAVPTKPWGAYRMSSRTTRTNYDIDAISPTSTTFVESATAVQVIARHDPKEGLSSADKPQHKRVPSAIPLSYDVTRRQTGVSELSSISSGFGDYDIVVTPTYQTVQSVPSRPEPSRQPTWKSSASSRRDTTSTMASVDARPRFRSVNSWVKQQNGQLRRAQKQQENGYDSDAPPVPALSFPPDQDFRYMLPDDERPRPVEMV